MLYYWQIVRKVVLECDHGCERRKLKVRINGELCVFDNGNEKQALRVTF